MSTLLRSSLVAASLAAATGLPTPARAQAAAPQAVPAGPAVSAPAASAPAVAGPDLAKGRRTYQRHCAVCHGQRAEGGLGPPLQGIGQRLSSDDITHQLMAPRGAMPRMVPSPVNPRLLPDLSAYLLQLP